MELARLVSRNNFDLAHIHAERAAFWTEAACLWAGTRCVRTIHNEFLFEGRLRFVRSLQRRLMALLGVRHVSCSSRVAFNEQRRFGLPTVVIENWFDPTRIRNPDPNLRANILSALGIPSDAFIIVSIGNYGPAKNQEAILDAVRACASEINIYYLHCGAGADALTSHLDASIIERIRFLGSVGNVGDYLAVSDAFVNTSLFEGGPLALLEAAATGIPCITTRVGLAETLEGYSAVTFIQPTGESLADALRQLAQRPVAQRLSEGRAVSEMVFNRFTPEVGGGRYAELYATLSPQSDDRDSTRGAM